MKITDFSKRSEPRKVLMVHPEYFDVIDVKNVYMENSVGTVNKELALEQWNALLLIYKDLESRGILEEITVLEGLPGLSDMVFCANQSFPWMMPNGEKKVVMSNMHHEIRQKEVAPIEKFYSDKSYGILKMSDGQKFEGMGDCITQPNRNLAFIGHGYRSDKSAEQKLNQLLDIELVSLELINPNFYHLDTCFVPLNDEFVVLCESAFSDVSLKKIDDLFEFTYFISEEDAKNNFTLNAHCMTFEEGNIAIMPSGSSELKTILTEQKYEIFEVETSEFMKAGGSVFCMKMMYY